MGSRSKISNWFAPTLITFASALSCTRSPGLAADLEAASASATALVRTRPASSGSAAAPPVANAAPWVKRTKLDLILDITRDTDSGEETLWATIQSLGVHQALGHSSPPFVCGISVKPSDTNVMPPRPSKQTRIDCGDSRAGLVINLNDETLILGRAELKIPPGSFIVHEQLQQPLPPARRCGDAPTQPLAVSIVRESNNAVLKIPALKVFRRLAELSPDRPWYCKKTVLSAAKRMDFSCSTGQLSSHFTHLAVERDILFVENGSEAEIDGLVIRTRLGIELPCHSELRFTAFNMRTPNYAPLPDHCRGECWIKQDACSRGCAERESDEQGKLTDVGQRCNATCVSAGEACDERCDGRKTH